MEISRRTRYGILAGIWAATFLSVCSGLSTTAMYLMLKYMLCASVVKQYVRDPPWHVLPTDIGDLATLVATCELGKRSSRLTLAETACLSATLYLI